MVKGKLGILSAKEAKALLEGATSSSHKKGKRKRLDLPDTRVVDDPEGYKQSKAEVASAPAAGVHTSLSPNLSPTRSAKKAKSKSSEGEGTLTVSLLDDGYAYSGPLLRQRAV